MSSSFWFYFFAALIPISFFAAVAAVLILRPMTKKIGDLAASIERAQRSHLDSDDARRIAAALEAVASRLEKLEDRQSRLLEPNSTP